MSEQNGIPELSPRERGFVCRIMHKYAGGQHRPVDLYRSLAIFAGLIVVAHVIEQVVPTWWLPLLIILPPALFMFSRYRKFSIFRSCVLSKVARRLSQYEKLEPPAGGVHPHAAKRGGGRPQPSQPASPPSSSSQPLPNV